MITFYHWDNGLVNQDINDLYFDGKLSIEDHTKIMESLMTATAQEIKQQVEQLTAKINQAKTDQLQKLLTEEKRNLERLLLNDQGELNERYNKIISRKLTLYPSADLTVIKKTPKGYFFPQDTKVYEFIKISVYTEYYNWIKSKLDT
ncbi:MAG: hypothetical protein ACXITV_13240 [Luteibaculaceae bacterium]